MPSAEALGVMGSLFRCACEGAGSLTSTALTLPSPAQRERGCDALSISQTGSCLAPSPAARERVGVRAVAHQSLAPPSPACG